MPQLTNKEYYMNLLTALLGLRDDLDANNVPIECRGLIDRLIDICERDFKSKFGSWPD